jgi:protein O-mannosyl-transferase
MAAPTMGDPQSVPQTPPPPPPRLLRYAGAGAAAISLLVFAPHVRGDFVWDDLNLIQQNPDLQPGGSLGHLITSPIEPGASVYRPLSMATFWIQAQLTGLSVPGLRLANVALHAGVAVALVALLLRLGVSTLAALLAAAVFLVHPSITEPVMWLNGRHDTLGALLALGALLLWIPRAGEVPSPRRTAGAAALAALALLCKETYVVLPLLAALDEARRAVAARPASDRLRGLALIAAPVPAYFLLRAALDIPGGGLAGVSIPALLQAWGTVLGRYALQILGLSNGPTVETFVPWPPLRAALVLALVAGGAVALAVAFRRGARDAGLALLGLAWFALSFLPAALAIAIAGQYANRYAYFPLIGAILALAAGLDRALPLVSSGTIRKAAATAAALLVTWLGFRTSAQAARWAHEETLFVADVLRLPGDGRPLFHLAVDVQRRQGCGEALALFGRATQLAPDYVRAWHNLAGCLIRQGRFAEAVEPARRAVALDPSSARRHYNLGVALGGSGDAAGAMASFEWAVKLDPGYAPARRELERLRAGGR